MSLKFLTNFNTAPYHDDFDIDKKFLKILFNPKLPVQVRELVQIQSILSEQLSRLGDSLLKDGSMIIDGNVNIDTNIEYIKLNPKVPLLNYEEQILESDRVSINVIDITEDMDYTLSILDSSGNTLNKIQEGQTVIFNIQTKDVPDGTLMPYRIEGVTQDDIDVNLIGEIEVLENSASLSVKIISDLSIEEPEQLTMTVGRRLLDQIDLNLSEQNVRDVLSNFENRVVVGKTSGAKFFVKGITKSDELDMDTLYGYHISGSNKLLRNEQIDTLPEENMNDFSALVDDGLEYAGKSSFATINSGIFYSSGMFHIVDSQEIILEKYSDSPKYSIGLESLEKIIDYSDDNSLLDNATGTPNKNAPGADRFSVDLILTKRKYDDPLDDSITKNSGCQFYELVRVDGSKRINISKNFPHTYFAKEIAKERKRMGDRVAKPFYLDVDDSLDESKVILNFSPGKAYVNGFEVETNSKKSIEIDKSRTFETIDNEYISFHHGNYFNVEINIDNSSNSRFLPVFKSHEEIDLYDESDSFKIGEMKVKFIDFDPKDSEFYNYKIHFYDLNMETEPNTLARYSLSDVVYFRRKGADNSCFKVSDKSRQFKSILSINKETFISDIKPNSLIFDFSDKYIKEVNSLKYMTSESRVLVQTSFQNLNQNRTFISLSENSSFSNEIQNKILDSNNLSDNILIEKYFVVLDNHTGERYTDLLITLTENQAEIIVRNSNLLLGDNLNVVFKYFQEVPHRTKTRKTKTEVINVTDPQKITLEYADVISLNSVSIDSSNVDYKDCFTLDNGQRDNYYDVGSLSADTNCLPIQITSITVSYDYFEHSSNQGFFVSNSYLENGTLHDMGEYTSSVNGKSYDLLNSVDFRPTFYSNNSKVENFFPPIDSAEASRISYDRYLGRIDKVVIDENRNIEVIKGVPGISPKIPDDLQDKFTIYTLTIPPYTKYKNEIEILGSNNKEYLDFLIEKSKSQQISNQQNSGQIFKTGLFVDDFSDHSLSDVSSSEHSCSIDFSKKELRNSFKSDFRQFSFDQSSSNFTDVCSETFSNILKKGSHVLPNYDEAEFLANPLSSQTVLVNPHKSVSWHGDIKIFPSIDRWYNDSVDPEVVSNIDGKNNNWEVMKINSSKGFGTQWNDWEDEWFGNQEIERHPQNFLDTKESSSKRRDVPNLINKPSRNNKEENLNTLMEIVPFSRNKQIKFISDNLKPNTEFFSFYDNNIITSSPAHVLIVNRSEGFIDEFSNGEMVTGQTSGATARILRISIENSERIFVYEKTGTFVSGESILGEVSGYTAVVTLEVNPTRLISNSIGELCGYFTIPTGSKVGEKLFRLIDSQQISNCNSLSETSYYNLGKIETNEKTIKKIRPLNRKRTHMNVENSIFSDVYSREFLRPDSNENAYLNSTEYIAQSFEVNKSVFKDGLFLTSLDLFFKNKNDNFPVTVDIRPMSNGYPSPNSIIPFSTVTLPPKDVVVSENPNFEISDSKNTRFSFDAPIYLPVGEYCITVRSSGYEYELWSCENGKRVLDGEGNPCEEQLIVTQLPNVGNLFSSHNCGTYQPLKNHHLSFRLNKCDFPSGKFNIVFDSEVGNFQTFNLFNFQALFLDNFSDVSELKFEYSIDGSDYKPFQPNRNIELVDPLKLNILDEASDRKFKVKTSWESFSSDVSPMFDLETMGLVTVENLSSNTYVSKIVHLNDFQKSKDIRVFLDAYKPFGTQVDVFYKIGNSNDTVDFNSKTWVKLELINPKNKYSQEQEEYFELEYGNLNGANFGSEQFDTFDIFSIKIELKNDSSIFNGIPYLPKVKDLRVISLKDPVGTILDFEITATPDRALREKDSESVTFTVYTNAPDGTRIPYTLTGIDLDDITESDPNLFGLNGFFDIIGGTDSVTVTLVNDKIPEPNEYIKCTLNEVFPLVFKSVPIIDNPDHIKYNIRFLDCITSDIINALEFCNEQNICFRLDTENIDQGTEIPFILKGLQGPKSYNLSTDKLSVTESESININLNTVNVFDREKISYIIEGVSLQDFDPPLPSFSGEFLVIGNQASKSFKLKRDVLTEGDEIFKLKLVDYPEVFVEVEIVDSSNTLFD